VTEPLTRALLDLLRPELETLVRQLVMDELTSFAPPAPDPWMTVAAASVYARLSEPALRARIRRGTVRACRDGNRYLLDRRELDEDLRRSRRNSSEPTAIMQAVI
jgi:excisionase family DNA binding protein